MRRFLTSAAVLGILLLFGSAGPAYAQVSFSIRIGPPPPPRAYVVPDRPDPNFVWVEGYWYPDSRGHYQWQNGHWARPPAPSAYWVDPYYYRGRYFEGYWEDGRGRHWNRGRQRREERREKHRDRRNHDRD